MPSPRLPGQLFVSRQRVELPWKSVGQFVDQQGDRGLGELLWPGSRAWHLRHIVETFRLHVRTMMLGLGRTIKAVDAMIALVQETIGAGLIAAGLRVVLVCERRSCRERGVIDQEKFRTAEGISQ